MADQYVTRTEGVGLGIESVAGTGVAPQVFLPWRSQNVLNKIDVAEMDAALGVVDDVSDSEVVSKFASGSIGGPVGSVGVGFLLSGFFGLPSTGTATGGIYPHTFDMEAASIPGCPLTISRVNPVDPQRHSYGVVDSLEISAEQGGYVEASVSMKARAGVTAADTIAIPTEKLFASKHITAKLAANTGALGAAPVLSASRVQLTLQRDSNAFVSLGSTDPEFDRQEFKVPTAEIVVRYTDSQYDTAMLANTIKALQISMTNGTHSLVFTASKVKFRELEKSDSLGDVTTQTLSATCEFDTAVSRSIQAVLSNDRATYQAA